MISQHRRALQVISAAVVLDLLFGVLFAFSEHIPVWHGLYCALANAVTVGGDVQPTRPLAYLVTAGECALVVPLFAATFSLFTTGLTAAHVDKRHAEMKQHITDVSCVPSQEAGPVTQG